MALFHLIFLRARSALLVGALFFVFLTSLFSDSVFVKRVVDGDTLLLQDGRRVRLIGVDTPELHPSEKLDRDARRARTDVLSIQKMGKKASNFTKNLVSRKWVELEFDPSNEAILNQDTHGRLLAYVHFISKELPEEYQNYLRFKNKDGSSFPGSKNNTKKKLMLNAVLIQSGYANAMTRFPFRYRALFRRYEREAKKAKLGLWSPH